MGVDQRDPPLLRKRRRLGRAGNVVTETAFVLPMLLVFSLAVLEIAFILAEFHQATEAARRGARAALVGDPIIDLTGLGTGEATCALSGDSVTCTGATLAAAGSLTAILDEMRAIYPPLSGANIQVTYKGTGIAAVASGTVATPLVTVRLVNLRHDFFALGLIPGSPPGFTFPPFATTRLAPSQAVG
ncbi:MAG: hypothetical protein FJX68_12455 [Alphaproteobacteria bacterium]|nr:hypothetical protein [Alphaproteobacteria bacterium]